jgi:hypothetical protein
MPFVLWDTGAQVSLITNQYAKEARYEGRPPSVQITSLDPKRKNYKSSTVFQQACLATDNFQRLFIVRKING